VTPESVLSETSNVISWKKSQPTAKMAVGWQRIKLNQKV